MGISLAQLLADIFEIIDVKVDMAGNAAQVGLEV